jgi:cytoskeletal protein RodZ
MARPGNLVLRLTAALVLAGCQTQPVQDNPPKSPAAQTPAAPSIASPPVAIKPVPQDAPPPQASPPAAAPAASTIAPSAAAPVAPSPPKPTSSATKAAPKNSAAPTAPQTKPPVDAAASAAPKPAPLDLNSLEQRLKDTRAIGVFTKLSLKNQVDDLLSELREFHKGSAKMSQSVLRQEYDLLIIKVLSLLQNGDPTLATAISASREAIWGILMDPNQFAKI